MKIQRVKDIRDYFVEALLEKRYVPDKTGVNTFELLGASFIADEDHIFGKPNKNYIAREIAWYENMSRNVYDIEPPVPEIWKSVADKDGNINSNYGWCIFSTENGSQFANVIHELRKNKFSRRAVMIYNRPSMHVDYCKNGMSDFMCTNTVQYTIREDHDGDDHLQVIVQMRSNDVVFGYNNDFAWQDYVASQIQEAFGCVSRTIYWQVGSLHVYERHFRFVEEYIYEKYKEGIIA